MKDRLVTLVGGGGFIGRYVAQALLAAGARVRVAQPDPREAWFLKPLGGLGQTQFVAADVTKPDTVARAVKGAQHVVNLAGSFSGDLKRIHVDGARAVAEAARASGVESLVHFSAIGADVDSPSRYASTKGEAEFMKVRDGKNYWTRHYWQTRIASQNELRLGLVVIAFNDHRRHDVYGAPEKKDRARGGSWFMAKITDTSDLYKGYVTVSGNYKVSLQNLRVIVY